MLDKVDYYREIEGIVKGLSKRKKKIAPKYFYDERGSQLFEDITKLPEYYPTGTELGIMRDVADEIAELVGPEASLIEFGSGSSLKTRILLEHLVNLAAYVPVDISADHLQTSANSIQAEFPAIEVLPVVADFTRPFELPNPKTMPVRNVVYFPGSTIGNFTNSAAVKLLETMYRIAGEDGAMLIGVDLQKDIDIIERAYNDDAGVTAEFNLNMLSHLNNEFGADFDLDAFHHKAHYEERKGRIEMRLVSDREQDIHIGDHTINIARGEAIITEYSHKYTLEGFADMAAAAGFMVKRTWMDPDKLFSVQYCVR